MRTHFVDATKDDEGSAAENANAMLGGDDEGEKGFAKKCPKVL
jgi:hypothetical protein